VRETNELFSALEEMPVTGDGAINVPPHLLRPLRAIAQNIVDKLPEGSFFEGDLLRIYPPDDPQHNQRPAGSPKRHHSDITFLPVIMTADGGILDCSSVAKGTRAIIRTVTHDVPEEFHDVSQVGTKEMPSECVRSLVARVARQMLLDAYAQGVRQILGRHIAAIYKLHRDRPRPMQPMALICLANGVEAVAKLVWVDETETSSSRSKPIT
jgi:hypothetical protein